MAQKPVLGKGLASLLPGAGVKPPPPPGLPTSKNDSDVNSSVQNKDRIPGVQILNPNDIRVNKFQPRRDFEDKPLQELAQSIRENGIIQPLIVRKLADGFELIAGERRLRAAKLAQLKQVPVVVRKSTDRESLELAIIENVQREDLNCIDEALGYFQLMHEFSLTQDEIAKKVGKDRVSVSNYLRLLRLPEGIIDDLKEEKLSFGHGKALLGVDDNSIRFKVRKEIVESKLSVRATENRIAELKKLKEAEEQDPGADKKKDVKTSPVASRLKNISADLTKLAATRVEIKGSEKQGKIVFYYSKQPELDRILTALQNKDRWQDQQT